MALLSEHDINQTFFSDVRVPVDNCVGGGNNGWTLITNQLNHERVTLCSSGMIESSITEVRSSGPRETKLPDGRRVIDQSGCSSTWPGPTPSSSSSASSLEGVVGRHRGPAPRRGRRLDHQRSSAPEFCLEAFRLLMEIIGQQAYLQRSSAESVLKSRLEMMYRSLLILTFGGGTQQVQRDLIGMFGLGLPQRPGSRPAGPARTHERPRTHASRRKSTTTWTSRSPKSREAVRTGCPDPRRPARQRRPESLRQDRRGLRRRHLGRVRQAGLLGIALPRSVGGAGLGLRRGAGAGAGRPHRPPIPYLPTVVLGALPIAEFGTEAQQQALLPGVVDGSTILTAAWSSSAPRRAPTTTARPRATAGAWTGRSCSVPAGLQAGRIRPRRHR